MTQLDVLRRLAAEVGLGVEATRAAQVVHLRGGETIQYTVYFTAQGRVAQVHTRKGVVLKSWTTAKEWIRDSRIDSFGSDLYWRPEALARTSDSDAVPIDLPASAEVEEVTYRFDISCDVPEGHEPRREYRGDTHLAQIQRMFRDGLELDASRTDCGTKRVRIAGQLRLQPMNTLGSYTPQAVRVPSFAAVDTARNVLAWALHGVYRWRWPEYGWQPGVSGLALTVRPISSRMVTITAREVAP